LEGKLKDTGDPGKPWNINVEWQRWAVKTNVVKVTGDLRGDGAGSLRRTLAGELTGTPELLVLDLSDIEQSRRRCSILLGVAAERDTPTLSERSGVIEEIPDLLIGQRGGAAPP
jgi:hypothetical protein